jgi:hypothetical protein
MEQSSCIGSVSKHHDQRTVIHIAEDLVAPILPNYFAPVWASHRSHFDNIVGSLDQLFIVLDDDDGIASRQ